jgi:hypothetical protein
LRSTVIGDEDLALVLLEDRSRDALEHGLQGRLGVVRDDEDQNFRLLLGHRRHEDLEPGSLAAGSFLANAHGQPRRLMLALVHAPDG